MWLILGQEKKDERGVSCTARKKKKKGKEQKKKKKEKRRTYVKRTQEPTQKSSQWPKL